MRPAAPSILVVDDEADLRELIADTLSGDGFDVTQAVDGNDAIARLKTFAFDAIVTDLRLPGPQGMEVLDFALTRYPEVISVVMTGFGAVPEAVAAIKRGAIDFLIKPFQVSQLSRVLKAEIERRRLRQENAELRVQLRNRFGFD